MGNQEPKVMIVDDEGEYLDDFNSLFSKKFNLIVAKGGEEGLSLLEKENVGIVISDQRMPRMTGGQFLAIVAERFPKTVRILLTGYCDHDALAEAVNKGKIFHYLSKDIPLKEIEDVIREALEKFKSEEEIHRLLESIKKTD